MSQINVRNLSNENDDGAPDIVGVSTFSATSYFVPSKGTTAQRPSDHVESGSLRFNTDTSNLEYYRGDTIGWSQFELIDPELGGGTGSNTGLGTRGIFYSGGLPSDNVIQFVTISTLGDATDFGDANVPTRVGGSFSSRTRCFKAGGYNDGGGGKNDIEFVTFSSQGNGTDFGDLLSAKWNDCGFSDTTRGIAAGGEYPGTPFFDVIEYVTMSSAGNAVDFGNLVAANQVGQNGAMSSSTRGVIAGGYVSGDPAVDTIQYVTISTTGNALDFGDLIGGESRTGCASNSVRGVIGAGSPATNRISYITMATLGNAVDFGDSTNNSESKAGMSSPTRAIWGASDDDAIDTIEYVEIMTTGNAIDFGNLLANRRQVSGSSNGHGGL